MSDSKESLAHDGPTDNEITKIAQQISGGTVRSNASVKQMESTQKILNAIGSESEQSKLTGSKLGTDQTSSVMQSNKHDTNPNTENILLDDINITPDLVCSITCSAQENDDISNDNAKQKDAQETLHTAQLHRYESVYNENLNNTISSTISDTTTGNVNQQSSNLTQNTENCNENTDKNEASADKLTEVVPESMYTVLQQRAQNVLKMITEKSLSENQVIESHTKNQSQTILKQQTEIMNQSNESTHSKGSHVSIKNIAENKSFTKSVEQNENVSGKLSENKLEFSPHHFDQNKVSSKLITDQKSEKEKPVLNSESQQSASSTEQCTTDYNLKNKSDSHTSQKSTSEKVSKDLFNKMDTLKATETLQQAFSEHSTQAVIKELSQIIQSNDIPDKLTKRGEIICYFFKQKLLSNLEAAGNLDMKSAELVNVTSTKFAKWMEEILNEIDTRKKKTANDFKGQKEDTDEDEFVSAASSKESLVHKENPLPAQPEEIEEKTEVVKIHEISEDELKEKYGSYLDDETKHEVFNFVGPDESSVEVKHLFIKESNAKLMIVKKKFNDSKPSSWVVEVGPDVTLESVSGSVSKNIVKEENEKETIILKLGEWNLEQIGWENWLPKVLAATRTKNRKIPILKKQCMLKESDYHITYPTYSPSLLALGTVDRSVFDGSNIMLPTPPQTEPSAPLEN